MFKHACQCCAINPEGGTVQQYEAYRHDEIMEGLYICVECLRDVEAREYMADRDYEASWSR